MHRNSEAVRERREKLEWFWKAPVGARLIASATIAGPTRIEDKLIFAPNFADRRRNRGHIDVFRYSPECFRIQSGIGSTVNLR
jgi:hypothetical protein